MKAETCLQLSLPGIKVNTSRSTEASIIHGADCTLSEFVAQLGVVITCIYHLYINSKEDVTNLLTDLIEDFNSAADQNTVIRYPYLLGTIALILEELPYYGSQADVTFKNHHYLKQDINAATQSAYLRITSSGEVVNHTKKGEVSSSRLLVEINSKNPDHTIGYFLFLYWIELLKGSKANQYR